MRGDVSRIAQVDSLCDAPNDHARLARLALDGLQPLFDGCTVRVREATVVDEVRGDEGEESESEGQLGAVAVDVGGSIAL